MYNSKDSSKIFETYYLIACGYNITTHDSCDLVIDNILVLWENHWQNILMKQLFVFKKYTVLFF